jgi:hypothetical protein
MDKDCLHTQIFCLKEIKGNPCKESFAIELMKVTGYVNIIDLLLLPLYYTWEQLNYGTLDEVKFEPYLKKAYLRFLQSAKGYTLQIVMILKQAVLKEALSTETRSIIEALIKTYSTLNK